MTPIILNSIKQSNSTIALLQNFKTFYVRRFYRLFPALGICIACSSILMFFLAPVDDLRKFSLQGLASLFGLGNIGAHLFSGDYFAPNPNPLIHTWTLAVEEQFYILAPLLLIIFFWKKIRTKQNTYLYFYSLGFFSFILFNLNYLENIPNIAHAFYFSKDFTFYSPLTRFWEFIIGSLGFIWVSSSTGKHFRLTVNQTKFLVTFLICLQVAPFKNPIPSLSTFITCVATILVIVLGTVNSGKITSLLSNLGDKSYSIYLVHVPILYFAKVSPYFRLGGSNHRVVQTILGIVLSLILGTLLYKKIEIRFRLRNDSNKSQTSFKKLLLSTWAPPLFLLLSIFVLDSKQYLGLNHNAVHGLVAWKVDKDCQIMTTNAEPCVYGNRSSKHFVLLIGDSHAAAISQAVINSADSNFWKVFVWTHPSCRVVFNANNSARISKECKNANLEIEKWIRLNHPSVVIVSEYIQKEMSLRDLQNGISVIESYGSQLLLIGNPPIFPVDNQFKSSNALFMKPYVPSREMPLKQMNFQNSEINTRFLTWSRTLGINTLDPIPLFCDLQVCKRWLNGEFLYVDDNHLSVAGSKLLIPNIKDILDGIENNLIG